MTTKRLGQRHPLEHHEIWNTKRFWHWMLVKMTHILDLWNLQPNSISNLPKSYQCHSSPSWKVSYTPIPYCTHKSRDKLVWTLFGRLSSWVLLTYFWKDTKPRVWSGELGLKGVSHTHGKKLRRRCCNLYRPPPNPKILNPPQNAPCEVAATPASSLFCLSIFLPSSAQPG